MHTPANSHITIDPNGVARIDNSRMKVIHIVQEMQARSATPEQLRQSYPHLSLAQIYAALAYYYDHQAELDAQIARDLQEFDAARAAAADSPIARKFRDLAERNKQ